MPCTITRVHLEECATLTVVVQTSLSGFYVTTALALLAWIYIIARYVEVHAISYIDLPSIQ